MQRGAVVPTPLRPAFGDKDKPDFLLQAAQLSIARRAAVRVDVRNWLERQRGEEVEVAFVALSNVESAVTTSRARRPIPGFAFALGSCQYVPGLIDKAVSQSSLTQLAEAIDTREWRCDLALFVGDQIYADATAGLIDPTRRDERYDQPNDNAIRASGMRAVLRRVPARLLLDDHEINDNWEPLPRKVARQRPAADIANREALDRGARAWLKFQRMRLLKRRQWAGKPVRVRHGIGDLEFMAGGLPFWFADTRTGRSARGSTVPPDARRILRHDQWLQLKTWLRAHRHDVKFIATPSLLLPRRRTTAAGIGGSDHSDAWDGFPASMDELLAFIVNEGITNTVFLSGDEHHAMVAEAFIESRLLRQPRAVKVVSVHSSGLYAPFPFANGAPGDLVQHERFSLPHVHVQADTTFAPPGDGFARLRVERLRGGVWALHIDWIKRGGHIHSQTVRLS